MSNLDHISQMTTDMVAAQNELLDYTGHVRALPARRLRHLVATIQQLRLDLGWEPLDMAGR